MNRLSKIAVAAVSALALTSYGSVPLGTLTTAFAQGASGNASGTGAGAAGAGNGGQASAGAGNAGNATANAATDPSTSGLEKAGEVVETTPADEQASDSLEAAANHQSSDDDESGLAKAIEDAGDEVGALLDDLFGDSE